MPHAVLAHPELKTLPEKKFIAEFPDEFGTLHQIYFPEHSSGALASPFVIHIQDAHANPEAQSRIRDILHWLLRWAGDSNPAPSVAVALEGTSGEIHPEYLEYFEEFPAASEAVIEELHQKGELTGAELFAWDEYQRQKKEQKKSLLLGIKGAEDPKLYSINLRNYRRVLLGRNAIEASLAPLRHEIQSAQSHLLNPALHKFLREEEKNQNPLNPSRLKFLIRQTRDILEIDLTDRIEQLRFPHLARFIFMQELEEGINIEKAETEWRGLKEELKKARVEDAMVESLERAMKPGTGGTVVIREIFEGIAGHSERGPVAYGKYPHWMKWLSYRLISQEVESSRLFQEIEWLTKALLSALTENENEKRFLAVYKNFQLLEKLLRLDLVHDEYDEIRSNPGQIYPRLLAQNLSMLLGDRKETRHGLFFKKVVARRTGEQQRNNSLESFFRKALRFYEQAKARDRRLLDKATQLFEPSEKSGLPQPQILVLIAGGFHTEGLTRQLQNKNIAHAVIMPRITHFEKNGLYEDVMRGKNADISRYLKETSLTKQEALFFKGAVEKVFPQLFTSYHLSEKQLPQRLKMLLDRHPVFKGRFHARILGGEETPFARLNLQEEKALPVYSFQRPRAHAISEQLLTGGAGMYRKLQLEPLSNRFPASRPGEALYDLTFHSGGKAEIKTRYTGNLKLGNVNIEVGTLPQSQLPYPALREALPVRPGAGRRSELRLEFSDTMTQMSPVEFLQTHLQFERKEMFREKRRPILTAFDSYHMNEFPEIVVKLWNKWHTQDHLSKPAAIFLQRYIGVPGFAFGDKKELKTQFERLIGEHGFVMQSVLRGRHENNPILLPGPYVGPELFDIIETLQTKPRKKILRTVIGELTLSMHKEFQSRIKDILKNILISPAYGESSFIVFHYTSDYGRKEELEAFIQAMKLAVKKDRRKFQDRNLVLLTKLKYGTLYRQFNRTTNQEETYRFHDEALQFLHEAENDLGISFYDFQNSAKPFFSTKREAKIKVINLPEALSSRTFNTLQDVSDLAVVAGDMGLRHMFTLPNHGIGPVFLFYPHPQGQADMADQIIGKLKREAWLRFPPDVVNKSESQGVEKMISLLSAYFELQNPEYTPSVLAEGVPPVVPQLAELIAADEEVTERYRTILQYLAESDKNAFNFMVNLAGEIEKGRPFEDIRTAYASIFLGKEIAKKHGKQFKKHFLLPVLLNFTTGHGDSDFLKQILEVFEASGANIKKDVTIFLADRNIPALAEGLKRFERVSQKSKTVNLNDLRFLTYEEDPASGKIRFIFLQRRPGAEPISEILNRLPARSEKRASEAPVSLNDLIERQKSKYAEIAGVDKREAGFALSLKRLGGKPAGALAILSDPALDRPEDKETVAKALAFGKGGIFHFWQELRAGEKRDLIEQLKTIDIDEIESLHQRFIIRREEAAKIDVSAEKIKAPPIDDTTQGATEANVRAQQAGEEAFRQGKVAMLELAGGSGSRFGGLKIRFAASQVMNWSLGKMRAQKIRALAEEYGKPIPWLIMTSDVTHDQTLAYFRSNLVDGRYFGYIPQEWVRFKRQTVMPQITGHGEFILESKYKIVVGGFGHGDARDWVLRDPEIQAWLKSFGIEYVAMVNVDNAFLPEATEIGYHVLSGSRLKPGVEHLSVQVVEKTNPAEKVGLAVLLNDKDGMIEYNQIPEEMSYVTYVYEHDHHKFVIYKTPLDTYRLMAPESARNKVKELLAEGKPLQPWIEEHLLSVKQLPNERSLSSMGRTYTQEALNQQAHLWLRLGNTNTLIWSLKSFLDASHPLPNLPVVVARDKIVAGYNPETFEYHDLNSKALKTSKFERMAFHGFITGESKGAHIMIPRSRFAPIKNPSGIDSPETAAAIFIQHARQIIRENVNWNVSETAVIELSPAFAFLDGRYLSRKLGSEERPDRRVRLGEGGFVGQDAEMYLSGKNVTIGSNFRVEDGMEFIVRVDDEYNNKARVDIGDNVTVASDVLIHLKGSGRVKVEDNVTFDYPLEFTLDDGDWLHIDEGTITRVRDMLEFQDNAKAVFEVYISHVNEKDLKRAFLIRKLADSYYRFAMEESDLYKSAKWLREQIAAFEKRRILEQILRLNQPLAGELEAFLNSEEEPVRIDPTGKEMEWRRPLRFKSADEREFKLDIGIEAKLPGDHITFEVNDLSPSGEGLRDVHPIGYYDFLLAHHQGYANFSHDSSPYYGYKSAIRVRDDYKGRNLGLFLAILGLYVAKLRGKKEFAVSDVEAPGFFRKLGFVPRQRKGEGTYSWLEYVFDLENTPLPPLPVVDGPAERSELRLGPMTETEQDMAEPLRIGFMGVVDQVATDTAARWGSMDHKISFADTRITPEKIKNEKMPDFEMLRALKPMPFFHKRNKEGIASLIYENDIIVLDTALSGELDYPQYITELFHEVAAFLAAGLENVRRERGSPDRKLFIVKDLLDVGDSDKLYRAILNDLDLTEEEANFDIVYQDDLSYWDDKGKLVEEAVIFGLRASFEEDQTKSMIERIYAVKGAPKVQLLFENIENVEHARQARHILLGTKLALFNDGAALSKQMNVDFLVYALGAALDPRVGRFFTNPSYGFGGRLLARLKWIFSARIARAVRDGLGRSEEDLNYWLDTSIDNLKKGTSFLNVSNELMDRLRIDEADIDKILVLLWLKAILRVNEQTQKDFYDRILYEVKRTGHFSMGGLTVTLIGLGHSARTGRVTDSPALELVKWLVSQGVKRFRVSDPNAIEAFKVWLTAETSRNPRFRGIHFDGLKENQPLDIMKAIGDINSIDRGDIVIIAAPHPDLEKIKADEKLNLSELGNQLKGRLLFDAIGAVGLRPADWESPFSFEDVRKHNIKLVRVGTQSVINGSDKYNGIKTSEIITKGRPYPVSQGRTMNIAIAGGGYVGLINGAHFASDEMGNQVHVYDIPARKRDMEDLNTPDIEATKTPIFEPYLLENIKAAKKSGRIRFSVDKEAAIRDAFLVLLAVGTPSDPDSGEIDLKYILSVVDDIAQVIQRSKQASLDAGTQQDSKELPEWFKLIAIKSTVTPNAYQEVADALSRKGLMVGLDYDLISLPEFLQEGDAWKGVTYPTQVIIGFNHSIPYGLTEAERKQANVNREIVRQRVLELFYPLREKLARENFEHAFLLTNPETAHAAKYGINTYLAATISAANTLARDGKVLGTDYTSEKKMIKLYRPIGPKAFVNEGCGYGGSCFPKDKKAFENLSKSRALHPMLLGILGGEFNEYFKASVVREAERVIELSYPDRIFPLSGKTVAIWGFTFKPGTDDIREAPSLAVVYNLVKEIPLGGVEQIRLYDPVFDQPDAPGREKITHNFYRHLYEYAQSQGLEDDYSMFEKQFVHSNKIVFTKNIEETLQADEKSREPGADIAILLTEWPEFKAVNVNELKKRNPHWKAFVDGRDLFIEQPEKFAREGIDYQPVGAPAIYVKHRSERREESLKKAHPVIPFISKSTFDLQREILNLKIPAPFADYDFEQLQKFSPELTGSWDAAETAAGRFIDLRHMLGISEWGTWRLIQLQLISGQAHGKKISDVLSDDQASVIDSLLQALPGAIDPSETVKRPPVVHLRLEETSSELMRRFAVVFPFLAKSGVFLRINVTGITQLEADEKIRLLRDEFYKLPEAKLLKPGQLEMFPSVSGENPFASLRLNRIGGEIHAVLAQEESVLKKVRYRDGLTRWKFDEGTKSNADLLVADLLTVIAATALERQMTDSYYVDYLSPKKAAPSFFQAALAGITEYLKAQAKIQIAA